MSPELTSEDSHADKRRWRRRHGCG